MHLLPRRLHTRLLLAVTLVMMLGTLGLALWTSSTQVRQLLQSRIQQAALLSANLAEGSAHAYVIEDYAMLDHFLRHATMLPGLRKVVATDSNGMVLSAFERPDDVTTPMLIDARIALKVPAAVESSLQQSGTQLVAWQPVVAGGLLGWLQLTYGLEEITALQRQIWQQAAVLSCVELLVGLILFILLLRRPIRSISRLSRFARELPQNKGVTIPVERFVTEVQDLGESLNYASSELQRIEQELLQLNRTLEARVEEEVARSRDKDVLLLQQARFQTMAELLVNIAHHWRQPLNNIGARVQENAWLVAQGELPPESAMTAADQVLQELKQLSRSIEGFQLLCRPAGPEELLLPSDAVRRAMVLVRDSYQPSGIRIELQLQAEQPVHGSLQDLVQCLLNLLSNARDAILSQEVDAGLIRIAVEIPFPGAVRITVSDNGGGIPHNLLDSLFDPYVTSKFRSQGVGLGLFVVRRLIEQRFHGSVAARNTEQGAVVTIEIPTGGGES